jgi:CelD/BcsL family acetyltransferase involved in cellulose biosynthesis
MSATVVLRKRPDSAVERAVLRIVSVKDRDDLKQHLPAIDQLCSAVQEANVFYEPWMFNVALEIVGGAYDLVFALAYAEQENGSLLLCGVFPLERHSRYNRIPVGVVSLWQYEECNLCTPLLRPGFERRSLEALFTWARVEEHAQLVECRLLARDGDTYEGLRAAARTLGMKCLERSYHRPILMPSGESHDYIRCAISKKHRRTLKAQEQQLSGLQPITYRSDCSADGIDVWLKDFMRLEVSGWKAWEGVASKLVADKRDFVGKLVKEAWKRDRILVLSMYVGDTAVGATCCLKAEANTWFWYKTAYDNAFARYSPGTLLQLELTRRLFARSDVAYVDSCVSSTYQHHVRWSGERALSDVLVSTGSLRGDLSLLVLPAIERAKRKITQWRTRQVKQHAKATHSAGDAAAK